MEACGAAKIVRRLFENVNEKCYVASLVMDDYSSVRKNLTHSYRDLLQSMKITENEWPRYANGKKKPDTSLLPLLYSIIVFLADKGHLIRRYSRLLFTEVNKSKKDSCGCTKMDAERMKRRLSWTLRLHCVGTYQDLRTAVHAVLEHHFDNRKFCGDWCRAATGTAEVVRDTGLHFRCKEHNKELYLFMKDHHEECLEDRKL
jgi:hypothetical protein